MCLTNLSVNITPLGGQRIDIIANGRVGSNARELKLLRRRRGATLTISITTAAVADMREEEVRCRFTNVELQQQLDIPEGVRTIKVKTATGQLLDSYALD